MTDIAIKVENISKKYQIGENKNYPTLRDKLMELPNRLFKGPKKNKEFWALKDVSFEVKKGEVVGIIGRNGAGKSTMLKILARITEPTTGKITMYGRVASMLEVGTGFNPELTGRENIFLNGAIIGMKKSEIKSKFDDIVDFSGVGKFLDTPVKHYSSGMYVRLAFAVAAHLDADILLVDEVLAVGDTEFQKKCLGKMSDLAGSGKTVILVSHNLDIIRKLCNKTLYLDEDKTYKYNKTEIIIQSYIAEANKLINKSGGVWDIPENCHIHKETNFTITEVKMTNSKGKTTNKIHLHEAFTVCVLASSKEIFRDLKLGFSIARNDGLLIGNSYNYQTSGKDIDFNNGEFSWKIKIKNNILNPGVYLFGLNALTGDPNISSTIRSLDNIGTSLSFVIEESTTSGSAVSPLTSGIISLDTEWT